MTKGLWQCDRTGSSHVKVGVKQSLAFKESAGVSSTGRDHAMQLLLHLHLGDDLQGTLQLAGAPRRRDESVVHDRIRLHPRDLSVACRPRFMSHHCHGNAQLGPTACSQMPHVLCKRFAHPRSCCNLHDAVQARWQTTPLAAANA
jgi:hypothetical protein